MLKSSSVVESNRMPLVYKYGEESILNLIMLKFEIFSLNLNFVKIF